MYLLILGLVLLVLKWCAWGPVASLPWWVVLVPFVLAVVWWRFADWSGYSSRAASAREQRDVQKRRSQRAQRLDRRSHSR
jgi:small Trp-rich protein